MLAQAETCKAFVLAVCDPRHASQRDFRMFVTIDRLHPRGHARFALWSDFELKLPSRSLKWSEFRPQVDLILTSCGLYVGVRYHM